ncbi:probable 26S proteasome non-ATPase regulatory subunit 3 isoform X2 [Gossypium hirsutum]|uniref:Probable 26S proteasome non-ATPase regulatory subunit 3 isoform X2 n=1 Tax=Gossypium hirsutum TaxID=3635 RepID=A0ABM3A851_GOSHI|nr:probable 26S proteasome non-ATPase regulatory subunit 3 isoform X2 [Gossypium hirsutum]
MRMTWKSILHHLLFRLQQITCCQSSRFTANLLVLLSLIDRKKYNEAKACSSASINLLKSLNRRTLLASRLFFHYSYSYELTGDLAKILGSLLALHRIALLHHDVLGQAEMLSPRHHDLKRTQTNRIMNMHIS